jgi:hypothetical protein
MLHGGRKLQRHHFRRLYIHGNDLSTENCGRKRTQLSSLPSEAGLGAVEQVREKIVQLSSLGLRRLLRI